jgi:hypothetical protein
VKAGQTSTRSNGAEACGFAASDVIGDLSANKSPG